MGGSGGERNVKKRDRTGTGTGTGRGAQTCMSMSSDPTGQLRRHTAALPRTPQAAHNGQIMVVTPSPRRGGADEYETNTHTDGQVELQDAESAAPRLRKALLGGEGQRAF